MITPMQNQLRLTREPLWAPPFFLAHEIELPPTLVGAVDFMSGAPQADIKKFWSGQVSQLRDIKRAQRGTLSLWREVTPASLKGSTTIDPVILTYLLDRFGLGGSKWLKQLVFGFPITGLLSQRGAYPIDTRVKLGILKEEHLFGSALRDFRKGLVSRHLSRLPNSGLKPANRKKRLSITAHRSQ